jgi:hypothetical protein
MIFLEYDDNILTNFVIDCKWQKYLGKCFNVISV